MAKPNCLWICRTRLHRLVRWIDGVETEFPVSFGQLAEDEQQLITYTLKALCDELDDYQDRGGLLTEPVVAVTPMGSRREDD